MHLLSMTWRDVLFAHWPVDPARVQRRLPPSLDVDTYEGQAFLGVVAFENRDVRPRGSPVGLSFPELNLRTYVTDGEGDGVYFFTLDADDPLGVGVARSFFQLPYRSASMDVQRDGDEVSFRSRRHQTGHAARFEATYGPDGTPFSADEGSLEAFLTERYRFYTASDATDPGQPRGRVFYGDVEHDPWSLQRAWADVEENELFDACGFAAPNGQPHLLYASRLDVDADRIRRL
jgi:uncharacterized protein YqjF (DUF2071 family)